MEHHTFAGLIPAMSADEFSSLKADIQANGLLQPVLVFQGKVLDGRHRMRACNELGVPIGTEEFIGTEAEALRRVISLNLARRHLTTAQRAEIAASLVTTQKGRQPNRPNGLFTDSDAAELMGVSPRSVRRAKAKKQPKPEPKPKSNAPANSRPWVDVEPGVWDAFKDKAAADGVPISRKMGEVVAAAIQEDIDAVETFAPSQKEKFAAALRVHKRHLEAEFETRIRAGVNDALASILPQLQDQERRFNQVLNAQKGVFPLGDYQKILKCLHPDTQPDTATRGEAFRLFTEKKVVLMAVRENPSNGSGLPATVAELLSRRKNKR